MEDHDYAELGAPKSSKSKKSKRTKDVKQDKKSKGSSSVKRPANGRKQNGDIRRTSSEYRSKESNKLRTKGKESDDPPSLDIAPYATIPRKDHRPTPKEQNEGLRRNGSVNQHNGEVQNRDGPPQTDHTNVQASAREDSKEMDQQDISGLYAKVSKRQNGSTKSRNTNISIKESQRPVDKEKKEEMVEEDFSQLYAEVDKERRKERPSSVKTSESVEGAGLETSGTGNSASKESGKAASEDFDSNPYAEIASKRRPSYNGKENTSSFPRSGKRGSLSLSFRSFRSQKSDVTDEGGDSLTSNSLYNLIPEEPDKPLPDTEVFEEAPPLPAENTVMKSQDNPSFEPENVNASTSVDVEKFEDEGYKEAVRRRAMDRRKQESRNRCVKFLVIITVFLFGVLVIVLCLVAFLLIESGYFGKCVLWKECN